MRRIVTKSLLLCLLLSKAYCQDIHQSQFYTSPLNLNPALCGNFYGDSRIFLNYRNQYFVDDLVNYLTFTGSFDMRFYPKRWTSKGLWSGGLLLNYDQAGISKLGLTNVGVASSYSYPLKTSQVITIGGLIGGSSRRFDVEKLTWDEQWNGYQGDPTRPNGENLNTTSNFFLDLSAGLNYRWQKSQRTKFDAGIGAYHLNKPDQIFYSGNQKSKLPIRASLSLIPSIKLTNKIDLLGHALYQNQGKYTETVLGGYGKFYLNAKRGQELSILLGIASRLHDALIPKIALEYKNFYFGASYDINSSPFKVATNRRGGPEFSFSYTFVKARVLEQLRACPIY
ncbi:MAG: PorP/SprF family type IX secretion system membrane protein [Saprospiraceae bacterium]